MSIALYVLLTAAAVVGGTTFRLINRGDGVAFRMLFGVGVDRRGLGVMIESWMPNLAEANRLAAGDIEANRCIDDRMCGDAMFRRAASIALAFWPRIRSPAFSASSRAIFSRRDVSLIRNDGPDAGRTGVSLPSKRNGVPGKMETFFVS